MKLEWAKTWLCAGECERVDSLKRFIEWLLTVHKGNLVCVCSKRYQHVQYELNLLRLPNAEAPFFHSYVINLCEQYGIPYTVERYKRTRIFLAKKDLERLLSLLTRAVASAGAASFGTAAYTPAL